MNRNLEIFSVPNFAVLKNRHKGRPAAVLGAGPSLPDELETVPTGAVLLSVNQRPASFVKCDYIVFLDENTGPFVEGLPGKGCAPVILCGFDCYSGDHQYFDEAPGGPFIGGGVLQWTPYQHLKEWRRAAGLCPNPGVVRAAGGPLVEVFGQS